MFPHRYTNQLYEFMKALPIFENTTNQLLVTELGRKGLTGEIGPMSVQRKEGYRILGHYFPITVRVTSMVLGCGRDTDRTED